MKHSGLPKTQSNFYKTKRSFFCQRINLDDDMKFCYIDESGTGDEPISVMVGVLTDHHRMNPTKSDWRTLLKTLTEAVGKPVKEIHTKDLYAGNSPFRQLTPEQRSNLIRQIFQWLGDRKHSIVYSAVEKAIFFNGVKNNPFHEDLGTLWRHMAFHVTLALQKYGQTFEKNKGNTVLIFDNKVSDQRNFTKLLLNPPSWSDSYYAKKKKQEQLDQIVDVPHFVDSKEVALIQLADFLCYFLRKHLELSLGYVAPKFEDEIEVMNKYASNTLELAIPKSNIFLNRGRCPASEHFYKFAPNTIR